MDDTFVAKTISDGQTTPLIYALDRLRKTPWDCSKSLMSLNSMIVPDASMRSAGREVFICFVLKISEMERSSENIGSLVFSVLIPSKTF